MSGLECGNRETAYTHRRQDPRRRSADLDKATAWLRSIIGSEKISSLVTRFSRIFFSFFFDTNAPTRASSRKFREESREKGRRSTRWRRKVVKNSSPKRRGRLLSRFGRHDLRHEEVPGSATAVRYIMTHRTRRCFPVTRKRAKNER